MYMDFATHVFNIHTLVTTPSPQGKYVVEAWFDYPGRM
jgi:hypothetical protein